VGFGAPVQAASDLYCDPTIRSQLEKQRADAWGRAQAEIAGSFPKPNDFDSMFCSPQITNMFNSLSQSLAGSLFGQLKGMMDQLMQQACQMAIAPLQMAANAMCIPSFSFSLNYSLPSVNTGICNGTPLFNVTPVYQGGYGYSGGNLPSVILP
jgi:hypothetical protein